MSRDFEMYATISLNSENVFNSDFFRQPFFSKKKIILLL